MINLTRSNIGKQVHNQMPLVAFAASDYESGAFESCDGAARPITTSAEDETANAVLTPNGGRAGIGGGAVAFQHLIGAKAKGIGAEVEVSPTLNQNEPSVMRHMQVRRLTPQECEALMGLPRNYTAITFNGKPAKDGPRYKSLGNSMVSDCMYWIGSRIGVLA